MVCKTSNFPNGIKVGSCFLVDSTVATYSGWGDYRDTATAATPIDIDADTWTSLTCNDVGSLTTYLPLGADGEQVDRLWDSSTNRVDVSELQVAQIVSVRSDFRLYPSENNAQVDFRLFFNIPSIPFSFSLEKRLARLDEGADTPSAGNDIYKLVESLSFFIGDASVLDAEISVQVKSTVSMEAEVNGFFISV